MAYSGTLVWSSSANSRANVPRLTSSSRSPAASARRLRHATNAMAGQMPSTSSQVLQTRGASSALSEPWENRCTYRVHSDVRFSA